MRRHSFSRDPRTKEMVRTGPTTLWELKRSGHDHRKVYAAYKGSRKAPAMTVVLAHTVEATRWALRGT